MCWIRLTCLLLLLKGMNVRNRVIVGGSLLVIVLTITGIALTVRSPLFLVQAVEVEESTPENAPLDADAITQMAAVAVGKVSLFNLDLEAIKSRVLLNEWVREVHLQKRFPQTLAIRVVYREPRALIQNEHGKIQYVDSNGHVFGKILLTRREDLPVLNGLKSTERERILEALTLIDAWSKAPVQEIAQLASLTYDADKGFRAMATYPLAGGARGRSMVDLGLSPEISADGTFDLRLQRLHQVFTYLVGNRLLARQIWADAGKKIIVKIARGS